MFWRWHRNTAATSRSRQPLHLLSPTLSSQHRKLKMATCGFGSKTQCAVKSAAVTTPSCQYVTLLLLLVIMTWWPFPNRCPTSPFQVPVGRSFWSSCSWHNSQKIDYFCIYWINKFINKIEQISITVHIVVNFYFSTMKISCLPTLLSFQTPILYKLEYILHRSLQTCKKNQIKFFRLDLH